MVHFLCPTTVIGNNYVHIHVIQVGMFVEAGPLSCFISKHVSIVYVIIYEGVICMPMFYTLLLEQ